MYRSELCGVCGKDFQDCNHNYTESDFALKVKAKRKSKDPFIVISDGGSTTLCTKCNDASQA